MKLPVLLAVAAASMVLSGCATKRYGRLAPVSGVELASYSCREIDLEVAKVEAFRQQIAEGAEFNGASLLGFLGDYGIGNAMEKNAAEKSATLRLNQLAGLKAQKCGGTGMAAPVAATLAPASGDPAAGIPGGVALVPAKTASGYCIIAPPDYRGTGSKNMPAVSSGQPRCDSLPAQ